MLPSFVSEVGAEYAKVVSSRVDGSLGMLDSALRRGHRSPEAWRDAVQAIAADLLGDQVFVASIADAYLNDVLDAQGVSVDADAAVEPRAFADVADGGGSWLQSLVYAPNSVRAPGVDWQTRFDFIARSIVKGGLNDTGRSSVQTGMQARGAVRWYVRMIRGVTCSRCAILAGRKYRSITAFRRHKRCDCVHIPAQEADDDWSVDPQQYFDSLEHEMQNEVFGRAGAEAIRLGADPAQVVNAESGVYVARSYGQNLLATTTGTTSRSLAGSRLQGDIRLMPDEIFLQAERLGWERAEVLRQLQRNGYLL